MALRAFSCHRLRLRIEHITVRLLGASGPLVEGAMALDANVSVRDSVGTNACSSVVEETPMTCQRITFYWSFI